MQRAPSVFVLLSLASACTRPFETPEPRREAPPATSVVATSAASTSPSAHPAPPAPVDWTGVAAWTDPKAIDALAADCKASPPPAGQDERDPLSCRLTLSQSCVPDLCFEEQESHCRPECRKQCGDCASTCTDACVTCKSSCSDDACRRACATTCGACRQACVTGFDHCTTGTCGAERKACDERLAAEWKAARCSSVCPAARACILRCAEKSLAEHCNEYCAKTLGRCPAKFIGYCLFDVTP